MLPALNELQYLELRDIRKTFSFGGGRITNQDLTPSVVLMLLKNGVSPDEFTRKQPMYALVELITNVTLWSGYHRPVIRQGGAVQLGNEIHRQWAGKSMKVIEISELKVPAIGDNFEIFSRQNASVAGRAVVGHKILDFEGKIQRTDREVVQAQVYQIYFDAASKRLCDPLLTQFYNETVDRYMETGVIRRLWETGDWRGKNFVGVLSYAFTKKTGKSGANIAQTMVLNDCRHDAYSFQLARVHPTPHALWRAFGNVHPGGDRLAKMVLVDRLGFSENIMRTDYNNAYSNFNIYKAHVFDAYVHDLLIPVMNVLNNESDNEVYSLVNSNAMYFKDRQMNRDFLIKTFGNPYYTLHSFFCERLPGFFLKEFGYTQKLIT